MSDSISNLLQEASAILENWFALGLDRKSEIDCDTEAEKLAASLYKRGLTGYRNDSETLVPALNFSTPQLTFEHLQKLIENKNTFIIADAGFLKHWPQFSKLKLGYSLEPSESIKNLETIHNILNQIPESNQVIVGLGGGIVTDMAGFVASLLQQEVHYVATTLLSSVDAAVGGKTGVNHPQYGKNQIGRFYKVSSLTIVPQFATTLPRAELCSGLVEALKHTWLSGNTEDLAPDFEKIMKESCEASLKKVLLDSYETKVRVVLADPTELGCRSFLNFGHSFGHAYEVLCKWPHGLAVGMGMLKLFDLGLIPENQQFTYLLKAILKHSDTPMSLEEVEPESLYNLLKQDKKNEAGQIMLTLPKYGILKQNQLGNGFKTPFNAQDIGLS